MDTAITIYAVLYIAGIVIYALSFVTVYFLDRKTLDTHLKEVNSTEDGIFHTVISRLIALLIAPPLMVFALIFGIAMRIARGKRT